MNDHNILSRHFPAPHFLDAPFVGIDISPLSMRMMEINGHANLRVGKNAEAFLTHPFSITDPDKKEVKDILMKWKKDYKLEYVKASLPEEKAYLFDTEIKFGTEEQMRAAIEFSLEENVPLSGPDVVFDYRLVGKSKNEGFVKAAVTVLPRDVVNNYLEFFHSCDLKPISFLSETQALARSLVRREDAGSYLIVNVNDTKSSVFIVCKGAVQFTSTIQMGAQDFSKALQKDGELPAEEILKIKETVGYARSENNAALPLLSTVASQFRQEVEKVYIYWAKHRSSVDASETIEKIIISGREALTLGFKEYLNQTLKVSIEVGSVWTNLASFDEYVPPITLAPSLNYGTVVGLSLPEKE